MNAARGLDRALGAWLSVLVGTCLVLFARGPADDAYIVARYARNLLAGEGLVFNAGERINALTSPAGLALVTLFTPLGGDPVRTWQVVAALATAVVAIVVARRRYAQPSTRLAFVALTLGSPFLLLWTVGGLETPLLGALVMVLALLAVDERAPSRRRALVVFALGTAAVFTRYDAALFAAPVVAACGWPWRRDVRARVALAVAAAAFAGWLAFCQAYYGDWLPTSFHVKFPRGDLATQAVRGLEYLASFALLALLPAAWAWRRTRATAAPTLQRTALLLGLALTLAYGILAATVHMMYAYRFFVPYLPALWLALLPRDARVPPVANAAILAAQTLVAVLLWQYSQNPNLSLLVLRQTPADERHEFSTLGARYTADADRAVRAQADDVMRHWPRAGGHARPPRMAVETGGLLPYRVPDAYVLEKLVSYRDNCANPGARAADYWQVFRPVPAGVAPEALPPPAPGWERVSTRTLTVDGLMASPQRLAVELWFQRDPAPPRLPPTIHGGCLPPALP
ncbi:MAG: hypothetical protein JSR18_01795 [Proteobacteria bacterium]|nr:hypothetical protein [Pseudomonadota bacterium]